MEFALSGWSCSVSRVGLAEDAAKADLTLGRFVAAVRMRCLPAAQALELALAHDRCSALTSLVMVDDAGQALGLLPEQRKVPLPSSPSIMAASMSSPVRMMRESLSVEAAMVPRSVRAQPPKDEVLRELALRIDWAGLGNAFLQGDLSALTEQDRRLLHRLLGRVAVVRFAARRGVPTDVVALAICALKVADQDVAAARFARRVLGNRGHELTDALFMPDWLLPPAT